MKIAVRILALILWFVVLTIGMKVEANALPKTIAGYGMFILSSTVTNVGILAVLASLMTDNGMMKSVRRGFTIYLMIISGVVVLFTNSISEATPEQYGKIAGTISLVCLVVSYKPEIFDSFVERIKIAFIGENKDVPD